MGPYHRLVRRGLVVLVLTTAVAVMGLPSAWADDVKLTGDAEVPPVTTSASGDGTITINDDHTVTGKVTTTGIQGTAAHIHQAAPGQNGPAIIPLKQDGTTWTVPDGAKLTDAQYEAYKAGNLYVNVHSAAHPSGEIRAQLKPKM